MLLALNDMCAKHAPRIVDVKPSKEGERKSIELTMEWVGDSLLDIVKRNEAFDWVRLRRNLTVALTDIADVGYIHNDLAPGASLRNITRNTNGRYYIVDYGKMIRRRGPLGEHAVAQQVEDVVADIRRLINVHNRHYDPTRTPVTDSKPPRKITLTK